MKNASKQSAWLTIPTLVLLAHPLQAQVWPPQPEWHLGVEVGSTQLDVSEEDFRIYQSDTSFGVRAGWSVTSNVDLVAGYLDMGRFDTVLFEDEVDEDGDTRRVVGGFRTSSATAWTAHAELNYELFGFLHPSVGLGVARWRLDIPDGQHSDTQDTAPILRLAVGFELGGNTRLDISAQRIGRLDARSGGLTLRFDF
ncbi:hypothetical protein VCB98_04385 [Gammaproteobacteria bacterium AB-CW1]|uniref:Outer membrane protein beta-barrel domain-containing protein n=1 Tax=Natronospira elongata TaxID=3110268 RepID=A0AAP6JEG0_9GAMM|nr:hypothetical protein [Gammaproteobacteria bacterium AB-CW1]